MTYVLAALCLLLPLCWLSGYVVGRSDKAVRRSSLRGGYARPSAYTSTRARGTRTPGTGTTAECSSWPGLTVVPADEQTDALTWTLPKSSYAGRGSSGGATVVAGANGALPPRVVWPDGYSRFYDPGEAA